ncbi:MAG: hypothetical protein IJN32_06715 [Thermoguttaceae bacterium]|nr:hypothetical protein [Thermoguttaceae bacterium]
MRVAQVVGKVVLSRVHPLLIGSQFKVVVPLTLGDLATPCPVEAAEATAQAEKEANVDAETSAINAANRLLNSEIPRKWGNEVVAYDDCSAAVGEWIALSEGAEAAAAFHPTQKPVDAFCGAILDALVVDAEVVAALTAKK